MRLVLLFTIFVTLANAAVIENWDDFLNNLNEGFDCNHGESSFHCEATKTCVKDATVSNYVEFVETSQECPKCQFIADLKRDQGKECDWNGQDSQGRRSVAKGNTKETCLEQCALDPSCKFVGFHEKQKLCHLFQKCDGENKNSRFWDVYEKNCPTVEEKPEGSAQGGSEETQGSSEGSDAASQEEGCKKTDDACMLYSFYAENDDKCANTESGTELGVKFDECVSDDTSSSKFVCVESGKISVISYGQPGCKGAEFVSTFVHGVCSTDQDNASFNVMWESEVCGNEVVEESKESEKEDEEKDNGEKEKEDDEQKGNQEEKEDEKEGEESVIADQANRCGSHLKKPADCTVFGDEDAFCIYGHHCHCSEEFRCTSTQMAGECMEGDICHPMKEMVEEEAEESKESQSRDGSMDGNMMDGSMNDGSMDGHMMDGSMNDGSMDGNMMDGSMNDGSDRMDKYTCDGSEDLCLTYIEYDSDGANCRYPILEDVIMAPVFLDECHDMTDMKGREVSVMFTCYMPGVLEKVEFSKVGCNGHALVSNVHIGECDRDHDGYHSLYWTGGCLDDEAGRPSGSEEGKEESVRSSESGEHGEEEERPRERDDHSDDNEEGSMRGDDERGSDDMRGSGSMGEEDICALYQDKCQRECEPTEPRSSEEREAKSSPPLRLQTNKCLSFGDFGNMKVVCHKDGMATVFMGRNCDEEVQTVYTGGRYCNYETIEASVSCEGDEAVIQDCADVTVYKKYQMTEDCNDAMHIEKMEIELGECIDGYQYMCGREDGELIAIGCGDRMLEQGDDVMSHLHGEIERLDNGLFVRTHVEGKCRDYSRRDQTQGSGSQGEGSGRQRPDEQGSDSEERPDEQGSDNGQEDKQEEDLPLCSGILGDVKCFCPEDMYKNYAVVGIDQLGIDYSEPMQCQDSGCYAGDGVCIDLVFGDIYASGEESQEQGPGMEGQGMQGGMGGKRRKRRMLLGMQGGMEGPGSMEGGMGGMGGLEQTSNVVEGAIPGYDIEPFCEQMIITCGQTSDHMDVYTTAPPCNSDEYRDEAGSCQLCADYECSSGFSPSCSYESVTCTETEYPTVTQCRMTKIEGRDTECGWDREDRRGRSTPGGKENTEEYCLQVCADDPNCQFASHGANGKSENGRCHLFETCTGEGGHNYDTFEKVCKEIALTPRPTSLPTTTPPTPQPTSMAQCFVPKEMPPNGRECIWNSKTRDQNHTGADEESCLQMCYDSPVCTHASYHQIQKRCHTFKSCDGEGNTKSRYYTTYTNVCNEDNQ